MTLARRIARPLLAGYFIYRGVQLLRNPEQGMASAQRLNQTVANVSGDNPALHVEPSTLVKLTGAVQVVCGSVIALGKHSRPAALTLAAITVPYAVSDFPFWEQEDPQLRDEQLTGLLADLSMVGGLLLAAVDTSGKPSLGWRARRAARELPQTTGSTWRHARREAKLASYAAKARAHDAADTLTKTSAGAAQRVTDAVADTWAGAAKRSPFSGGSSSWVDTVRESAQATAQRASAAGNAAQQAAKQAQKKANKQVKNFPWGSVTKKARDLSPV